MTQAGVLNWWSGIGRSERLMLLAAALSLAALAVFSGHENQYYLTNMTNTDAYTGMGHDRVRASGWDLRGLWGLGTALAVAAVFASPLPRRAGLRPWIFWAGAGVLLLGAVPTLPASMGGLLAYGGAGLALWTAWTERRARRAEARAR